MCRFERNSAIVPTRVGDDTVASGNEGTTPAYPAAMRLDAANIPSKTLYC